MTGRAPDLTVVSRYTKVAAERLTKTVIETAIAGGGGLVDTLRQSYSMNDLREEEMDQFERSAMVQSWHPAREVKGEERRVQASQEVPRRRAASVRQKRVQAASSTAARPSSMYGTIPR